MTPEENDLITSLFDRLRSAEGGLQKDREAEQLIARQVAAQPVAPYQLAQTVLVQEHALRNAQQRIADLERQLAASRTEERAPQSGGSFLSGLLGGNSGRDRAATPPPLPAGGGALPMQASAPPPAPGYPSTTNLPPSAGGGFLRSALATAAGVAGGSLLFQGIGNLLGHNAGPFSSFMGSGGGGGGFGAAGFAGGPMPMGGGGNTETINNYYGDAGGGSGGGGDGFMESGHGHHGGSGGTVGDFADQGSRGDNSAGFEPSDFDTSLPLDDGFQNLVDDNNAGADPGGFFDDGGGSSDDGTLV